MDLGMMDYMPKGLRNFPNQWRNSDTRNKKGTLGSPIFEYRERNWFHSFFL